MISHEHRAIFVHVPKTGGTSIELLLTGHDWIARDAEDYAIYLRERASYSDAFGGTLCAANPRYFSERLAEKHKTQRALQAEAGAAWGAYTTFSFVRNPWERLLSIYAHGLRDGARRMPASFREWILQADPLDHMGQPVFQEWIHDFGALDFIGRFEHFPRDFAVLLERIGWRGPAELPHERHGGGGRHDGRAYDAESRRRVAERCAEEIARFGYRFEDAFAPLRAPAAQRSELSRLSA